MLSTLALQDTASRRAETTIPVYVGVYLRRKWLKNAAMMDLHLGAHAAFPRSGEVSDADLISLKRVPESWQRGLRHYLINEPRQDPTVVMGFLEYELSKSHATTSLYFPINCNDPVLRKVVRRLPYFVEAMTTCYIKDRGVRTISTSSSAEECRERQLERIGLPVGERKDIREWLIGLGRGIKMGHPVESSSMAAGH